MHHDIHYRISYNYYFLYRQSARILSENHYLCKHQKQDISLISYELGVQYPQHLTRMFKKIVGMTPNEYRKQGLDAV